MENPINTTAPSIPAAKDKGRKTGLRPLAPILLPKEDLALYDEEFDYAFSEDRIRNIALSGPYGAGKNTVMESWEAHHSEKTFIHVELAHFDDPGGNDFDNPSDRDIEAEILNQLIHKTDAKKTPKSRFKRTVDHGSAGDYKLAIAIVAFIVIGVVLGWVLNAYTFTEFLTLPALAICLYSCLGIAWLALAIVGTKYLVKTSFLSKTMKKLKFVNAELEVTDKGEDSAFNRLMDDLLYLLNASGCDAVVFEDLDRFGSIGIFEKLRTINSLANKARPKGKTLKFVYLVHDGLFADSHDRTKFFDYIIPVIPYVDTSNSFDVLKSGLKGVGISVDDRFARGLSVFIDDPRILNAIIDEAFHYSKALGSAVQIGNDEDGKRLIGMLAYKEMFPRDFENLQIRRGYMHALLTGRARLIKEKTKRINAEIGELTSQIGEIQQQSALDEDDLTLLFLSGRLNEIQNNYYYPLNLSACKSPQEILAAIRGNKRAEEYYRGLVASLESNTEFNRRLATTKQRRKREIDKLQASARRLEAERSEIARMPLKELFDSESFFYLKPDDLARPADYADLEFEQVGNSPYFGLIPYLIRSGAVDESYERYTSNYYPLSLSPRDRDFVTAALQGIAQTDPELVLDNAETVIEHLDEASLARQQSRNYALFTALLEGNHPNEARAFLKGMEADDDLVFLVGYAASRNYSNQLFSQLGRKAPRMVSDALQAYDPAGNEAMRLFCHRLASDGGGLLDDPGIALGLREKASADPDFLAPSPANPKSVAEGLQTVAYRPPAISFDNIDGELAGEAYRRELFEPNADNVAGFLMHFGAAPQSVDPRMLTDTVFAGAIAPEPELLKRFVEENAALYIDSLVANIEGKIRSNENAIAWILNAETLDVEHASPFIVALEGVPIKTLSLINRREIKSEIMANDKVVASAANMLDYYNSAENAFDDTLVRFIDASNSPSRLNQDLCDELVGEDNSFIEDLIASGVSVDKMKSICATFGATFEEFAIKGLDEDRVEALIDVGVIEMTAANITFMRNNYKGLSPLLASSSIEKYCKLVIGEDGAVSEVDFDEDEVLSVFANPNVDIGFKLYLLDEFETTVALDEAYPEEILAAICKAKLDDSDLQNLPAYYKTCGSDLKQAIAETAASKSQKLMSAGVNMEWNMVERVLRVMSGNGDVAGATKLLAWKLRRAEGSNPSRQTLRECFSAASLEEFVKLLDGSAVKMFIPGSNDNRAILNRLIELDMCSDKTTGPNSKGFFEAYPSGHKRPAKPERK